MFALRFAVVVFLVFLAGVIREPRSFGNAVLLGLTLAFGARVCSSREERYGAARVTSAAGEASLTLESSVTMAPARRRILGGQAAAVPGSGTAL